MKISLEGARRYLKRNKIFFEIAAYSVLPLSALWVSVQQTEATKLQTKVAEAQALPDFEIRIQQVYNQERSYFDVDELVVVNTGSPVREFDAKAIAFAELTAARPGVGIVNRKFPILRYYDTSAVSTAHKGQLVRIYGDKNNARFAELQRALPGVAEQANWESAFVEEHSYLRINYRDILDRLHLEYYSVAPVRGATRLTEDVGRALFREAETQPPVDLQTITPQSLLDRASRP
jgi:hypothetical protein